MYIGNPYQYKNNFIIHYDITCKNGEWEYAMFNFVINDTFYPGKGVNWTLSLIVGGIEDFVKSEFIKHDEYLQTFSARSLYDLASFSRGYMDCYPNSLPEEIQDNITCQFGVEISLGELNDTGFDFYLYPFEEVDILVLTTDFWENDFQKITLKKGLCQSICRQFLRSYLSR